MMKLKPALLTIALAAALVFPTNAFAVAGGLQICEPSTTCEVGEYLFDDEYNPLAGATCTITSTYPDGSTSLFNLQSLVENADGWYSHKFTAPTTEGFYRSQICCTSGSNYLCIDKGFEVKADSGSTTVSVDNGAIAEAVWGYSDRTLSSFGTLVRDIWLNATRTLTSLTVDGSSSSSSTSTSTSTSSSSTQTIATSSELSIIQNTVNENRLILERLVNEPIIETFLEDDEADLGKKLDETRSLANDLYANTQYIRSKAGLITSKWNGFTEAELISNLEDLKRVTGEAHDSSKNSTMLGAIKWMTKSWGWESAAKIETEVKAVSSTLDSVLVDIATRGRSTYAYSDVKNIVGKLDTIEELIGDSTQSAPDQTLFGKLREVTAIANALDKENAQLADLLADWDKSNESDNRDRLNTIASHVSPLNRVPQLGSYLSRATSTTAGRELKNRAFALGGVIDTNKQVLARARDSALAHTWLEFGSIIFKSVIYNPSDLIAQKALLKYYLPPELAEEHVLKVDDGVEVKYDVERNQYFIEGEFELEPLETITVSVKTEDIWKITGDYIDSIKSQVEDLLKPLEGTAFYAQGITLNSEINTKLDHAQEMLARAVTPEQKIRAYREAMLGMADAMDMVAKLQDLVTQVSATSSLFAFVGGAQTLSVWGIIIVIIAAVVFLAVYMKMLKKKETKGPHKINPKRPLKERQDNPLFIFGQFVMPPQLRNALGLLIFGALVSAITAFGVIRAVDNDNEKLADKVVEPKSQVLADQVENEPKNEAKIKPLGGENIVKIAVPEGSSVSIRAQASTIGEIVFNLKFSTEAVKLGSEGDFTNIAIKMGENGEDTIEGWVHTMFVEESNSAENIFTSENEPEGEEIVDNSDQQKLVSIGETPTGWLRVRTGPRGTEITKVDSGDSFPYLDETTTWFKIALDDNTSGWISKEYSSIE